jgi:hypothetical protein
MSLAPVLQTGVALLAAGTPWVVASIVRRRAMSAGVPNAAAPAVLHAIRRLGVATAAISLPLVMLGLRVTPPSLALALASLAAFAVLAGLGLGSLHALDVATKPARELATAERVASLRPRDVGSLLPAMARLAPYALAALGLGAFVYQFLNPAGDRRLLVPIGFAGAAATFLLLYEAWMREEAGGGQAEGGLRADEVRRRVLSIYRMQLALVFGLLLAANILVGLDWTQHPNTGAFASLTGAFLGVVGCAQALASGYTGKRYQTVRR